MFSVFETSFNFEEKGRLVVAFAWLYIQVVLFIMSVFTFILYSAAIKLSVNFCKIFKDS